MMVALYLVVVSLFVVVLLVAFVSFLKVVSFLAEVATHVLLSSRTVVSFPDLDEVMVLSRNTMQYLF
jgi:hypothetical protein